MSLNGVIESFATGTYTLTRGTSGVYTDGRYVSAAPSTTTVEACVQPVSGRKLLPLLEGRRTDEVRVVFTQSELFPVTPSQRADQLTIDGEQWEVFNVERWQHWGETHYRSLVSRLTLP